MPQMCATFTGRLGASTGRRGSSSTARNFTAASPTGRQRLVCQAMHTIPSSTIQTAVRQAALLLGSGIYGVGDIIKRWEATDPKVRTARDIQEAKQRQLEMGYGIGNPSARQQLELKANRRSALPPAE
mmetsp:Transcript_21083/g.37575  ORF Transcript_21083/g.37575 Transcript_21083/m.37575 type:complete len:128 (-) Transcript_21083:59-442(-)